MSSPAPLTPTVQTTAMMPLHAGAAAAAAAARADEDLALSARDGSPDALEELVRRYQVPLLRFLRRGPCPREAEDVLQETWVRAMRSLQTYRPGRPFKPWIFTVCYRLAVDAARSRATASRTLTNRAPRSSAAAANQPDPSERVGQAEWADRFWTNVRRALGEESFAAAWLHYGESMPPREVAHVLGRSQVWVRTMLYRARKRLSHLFTDDLTAARKSDDKRPRESYDLLKHCPPGET